MIILSITITTLVMTFKFSEPSVQKVSYYYLLHLDYGLLGFLDDYIKVVMKRNLGLTSKQKLIGSNCDFCYFLCNLQTVSQFASIIRFQEQMLALILVGLISWSLFMLVGGSNAVNLTDGLMVYYLEQLPLHSEHLPLLAWNQSQYDVAIFSVAVVGAVLGFLVFNAHPAKVFMGDTGSLALGGAIAAIAF